MGAGVAGGTAVHNSQATKLMALAEQGECSWLAEAATSLDSTWIC